MKCAQTILKKDISIQVEIYHFHNERRKKDNYPHDLSYFYLKKKLIWRITFLKYDDIM